jgi:hypothetical protein
MEQRVESPRAQLITVTSQFLKHPLSDDRLLGGMMQNVNFPESQQELAPNRPLHISNTVIGYRKDDNPRDIPSGHLWLAR